MITVAKYYYKCLSCMCICIIHRLLVKMLVICASAPEEFSIANKKILVGREK